jgi:1-deoxy-D-xylulose-5-phosphate reductoisomerase
MKRVTILGSTGSIGVNTLDVIRRHPDRFEVFALSANAKVEELAQQCHEFHARYAVLPDDGAAAAALRKRLRELGAETEVRVGKNELDFVASHPDVDAVMAAIVGAAGLPATLAAARAGKRVLLANKEALVMAGQLFMDAVKEGGATLLPIDSEHNAIFQSMPRNYAHGLANVGVRKVILTASGGPFRTRSVSDLHHVTPAEACAHPNWVMGRKISVDSATMMNKGLEVIEARWLFDATAEQIDVVIHPQSIIHSMVEYLDGSVIAQLGNPDMRTPIAYGLGFPERIEAGVSALDLARAGKLEFEKLDDARFPCVRLAYAAMQRGGTASAVLNAANEIAVEAFLDERLRFVDIPAVLEQVLADMPIATATTLDAVAAADQQARVMAQRAVMERTPVSALKHA